MRLVVATGNPGKLEEFGRMLRPLGVEILSPSDCGAISDAEETGETFAENARIKALCMFRRTGLPSVADDSGLCVDALEGRPGVYSARYGGNLDYPGKIRALLAELGGVPRERRTARFVSAICCALGENSLLECEGVCEGEIGFAPAGEGGFGYDPVFFVGDESFAQMDGGQKDAVSHRGKALRHFAKLLDEHLEKGDKNG